MTARMRMVKETRLSACLSPILFKTKNWNHRLHRFSQMAADPTRMGPPHGGLRLCRRSH